MSDAAADQNDALHGSYIPTVVRVMPAKRWLAVSRTVSRMPFPRRVWIGPMCKSARNVLISFKSLRIVRPLAAVSSASCSMDSG